MLDFLIIFIISAGLVVAGLILIFMSFAKGWTAGSDWSLPIPSEEWDRVEQVPSSKYKNKFYDTNIHKRTCSCMDNYTQGQGKKICRHQAQLIVQCRDKINWPTFVFNAFEDVVTHGVNPHYKYGTTSDKQPYVLSYSNGNWFSLYRNDSPQESYRYGYIARDEEKGPEFKGAWAYGAKPNCYLEFEHKIRVALQELDDSHEE